MRLNDEYIIFKEIEITQENSAIRDEQEGCGPGDKYRFKYREVNNR